MTLPSSTNPSSNPIISGSTSGDMTCKAWKTPFGVWRVPAWALPASRTRATSGAATHACPASPRVARRPGRRGEEVVGWGWVRVFEQQGRPRLRTPWKKENDSDYLRLKPF